LLDAIAIEKRGVPAVVIGTDRLVNTTGRGMARAHGTPNFAFAVIEHPLENCREMSEVLEKARVAAAQVEAILLGKIDYSG
jgi:hypothetical protein